MHPTPESTHLAAPFRDCWLSDFSWISGQLAIRKTGVRIPVSWALVHEIANWVLYFVILSVVSVGTRVSCRSRPRIWFAPDRPRPWYLMCGAAIWAGIDSARSPVDADAAVYFDDSTEGTPLAVSCPRRINHGCTNISKSYVATVFASVFGYPLCVDPLTASGDIVEKPETNGVHGGRIVTAPVIPREGYVYQRLIDTRDGEGLCHDLRTPCAAGRPVVVWVKAKSQDGRFSIVNRGAYLADPMTIYSAEEQLKISEFCATMGLDWGGLDILRDRDGRIYIVDVNKTDLGPVIALSWREKLISMQKLAESFRSLVCDSA